MAEFMKDSMRDFFSQPASSSRPPSLVRRIRKAASRIRRSATSVRSAADRARTSFLLESNAEIGLASGSAPFPRPCLVGTFHKTGTILVWNVLLDLSRYADFKLWNMGLHPEGEEDWLVGFDWWSDFQDHGLDTSLYPTVVIVRDPRDVIVSSMKFHSLSREPWLHVPHAALGRRTYQQALLELPSDEERYLFELKHQGGATIGDMLAARHSSAHANTLFLPLEDLMGDRTLGAYRRLFAHLGLVEAYLPLAMSIAFKHSVFRPGFRKTDHITSGRAGQWQTKLPRSVLEELERDFPRAAEDIGYGSREAEHDTRRAPTSEHA